MCRKKVEGGRRCYHGSEYERVLRNLKARKQYHNRNLNTSEVAEVSDLIQRYESNRHYVESLEAKIISAEISLSETTLKILQTLTHAGYRPYIVGGAVRDVLADAPVKDVDIEVYGVESASKLVEVLKLLTKNVDEVGQQFGVIKVALNGEEFDVSLPRTENKTGEAHTNFEVKTDKDLTVKEASARRDFTVNALLYDYELEHIVDPYGGIEDWKNRKLRHVSDAFDEDPLRVLRGAQMAARFNMELAPETVVKAASLSDKFDTIAKERVQIEFQKLFTKSFHPHRGFEVIRDTNWDQNFPGLADTDHEKLLQQLAESGRTASKQNLDDDTRAAFFGAVIASHIDRDKRRDFLSYITVGDRTKNIAYSLSTVKTPDSTEDSSLRHWAKNAVNGVNFKEWLRVKKITNPEQMQLWNRIEKRVKQLGIWETYEEELIKGDILMSVLNISKNGRWVGEALRRAREAQYSNKFRTLEDGIVWIEENREKLIP